MATASSHVFVSYSHEDAAAVGALVRALEGRGISFRFDRDLAVGDVWQEKLREWLNEAGAVLVVWSRHGASSAGVISEATQARERMVPVRLSAMADVPSSFQDLQTLDLSSWGGDPGDPVLDQLGQALQARLAGSANRGTADAIGGAAAQGQQSAPGDGTAPGKTSEDRARHSIGSFLSMPWWAGIGAIAGVLAISGAVAAVIAILPSDQHAAPVAVHSSAASPLLSEEHMVSLLIAGDDYEKMDALIGAPPDFHKSLASGRQLYVFDRRWEYIQLLVNDDTVLSVGVYAKTSEFKTALVTGTIVNGPPISRQLPDDPLGADGSCGASWYYYFQGYSFPAAENYRSEIIGELPVTDTDKSLATSAPCKYLSGLAEAPCIIAYYRVPSIAPSLSSNLVACIDSLKDGKATLASLLPSIVIVTAPGQSILPDMFNEDYFTTLANTNA